MFFNVFKMNAIKKIFCLGVELLPSFVVKHQQYSYEFGITLIIEFAFQIFIISQEAWWR